MRAINGTIHRSRQKKVLKQAKGFRGARSRLYRTANSAVMKAGQHAYNSRRQFKRQMRALWIVRINAAVREHGVSYSVFMNKLKQKNILLDRPSLADLAQKDPEAFAMLVKL